jgi:hypothetical protein
VGVQLVGRGHGVDYHCKGMDQLHEPSTEALRKVLCRCAGALVPVMQVWSDNVWDVEQQCMGSALYTSALHLTFWCSATVDAMRVSGRAQVSP